MQETKQEAYYQLVGQIAMNWAALEAIVASAIWVIGGMHDAEGACVTSQIFNFDSKMKALRALIGVKNEGDLTHLSDAHRKALAELPDRLNTFFNKRLRSLLDYRNRLVHDPIRFEGGATQRFQITAPGRLTLGFQPTDLEEMVEKRDAIATAIDDLFEMLKPAIEAFPGELLSSADKSSKPPVQD